jgi:hypothetical protein
MNTDRTECRAVEDLLVALAAGELESEHAAQLRAHLTHCAACQDESVQIHRAGELATGLKLTSPEIDRYPEFLRRLTASEAQAPREAEAAALSLVESNLEPSSGANAPTEAGVAAVIPFFGNRVAVRNGFGQGFELRITSSQGRRWLHLSAKSLTRVAAVTAGIGLAAGISVIALLLIIFPFGNRSQPEFQTPPRTEGPPPSHWESRPPRQMEDRLWIQTVSNGERTLAIWTENAQLQAGWIEHRSRSLSAPFGLEAPILGNRPPMPPRMAECSIASDGRDFVVLQEIEGGIYLWHLGTRSFTSGQHQAEVTPPILISRKGAQPDVAWIVDRYVAVWVAPDMVSPVIEMIELGSDGRPLQTLPTVIARTEQGDKVGLPGITGEGDQVLVSWFLQSGSLMTGIPRKRGIGYAALAATEAGNSEGRIHLPIRLLAVPDGYLACWDVMSGEGAEIRLARLDRQGRRLETKALSRSPTPITSFDVKASEDRSVILLWSEVHPGGALTFRQRFSLDGVPHSQAENVETAASKPPAVVFGDADGRTLIWRNVWQPGGPPVGLKQLD